MAVFTRYWEELRELMVLNRIVRRVPFDRDKLVRSVKWPCASARLIPIINLAFCCSG